MGSTTPTVGFPRPLGAGHRADRSAVAVESPAAPVVRERGKNLPTLGVDVLVLQDCGVGKPLKPLVELYEVHFVVGMNATPILHSTSLGEPPGTAVEVEGAQAAGGAAAVVVAAEGRRQSLGRASRSRTAWGRGWKSCWRTGSARVASET